jgi:L-seryl-tRNA(Ser) seleniumtransferase
MKNGENSTAAVLRLLPSVDALLQTETAKKILAESGTKHLTNLARNSIDALRREILEADRSADNLSREMLVQQAENLLSDLWRVEKNTNLQRVINATGVIIHTNLGRAPLSEKAISAIAKTARYCTLEYDLETGRRGRRGVGAESLLAEITGAEDALIVNNCAAACVLVLTALAKGGEAIISRGELVEIGGDFRIPDVMTESGAVLREVGATNRTRISDYETAINENTRMILKVHPSNYRIIGFTESPGAAEIARLAHQKNILFYEDAGSGALIDLSEYGLTDEPVISQSIAAGADVITFSGDKLLGATQAGLIVGRREVIETLRKHPLYRALRANKLIYAALEATLDAFRRETALQEIPVLQMLSISYKEIEQRTKKFAKKLSGKIDKNANLECSLTKGNSVIGGGSAPAVQPESTLLALKHKKISAGELERALRLAKPPVITRILEDKVLIDLRTVSESEETKLLEILAKLK